MTDSTECDRCHWLIRTPEDEHTHLLVCEARELYFSVGGCESDRGQRTDANWYWRRAAKRMALMREDAARAPRPDLHVRLVRVPGSPAPRSDRTRELLCRDFTHALNTHGEDARQGLADHALAQYLIGCLDALRAVGRPPVGSGGSDG